LDRDFEVDLNSDFLDALHADFQVGLDGDYMGDLNGGFLSGLHTDF